MASVDHVFVFARRGAPERRRLLEHGLDIGAERRHQCQGTQNVCFGFADCYLELIWVCDDHEARSPQIAPLQLFERNSWRERAASPFGVCVRVEPDEPTPFASWPFRPDYLPDGMRFDMARNHDAVQEPLLFALDRAMPAFPTEHARSGARLRELRITTPLARDSLLRDVAVDGLVFVEGDEHRLELTLDDGRERLDLRPELPLVLRW